ncbi:MAG: SDR family oxidoreductase [Cryomorphaceae bacterium]
MEHPILIIGHSSGIGKALTNLLCRQGIGVIGVSRSEVNEAFSTLQSLQKSVFDLTEYDLPTALSGVIYCPGSINLKPFRSLKINDFNDDFETNALGAVYVLQLAEKALKAGKGSVVLFSTIAVAQGMPFHASVAMAKGAIEGLTRSLAAEWAPTVRVNAIAPSLTDTPLASKLLGNDVRAQAAADRHPLKRIGRAEEMAELAQYLLGASWISGEIIGLNGGMGHIRL